MSDLPIRPYERQPAAFHPSDPATQEVAREVARLVASACSIAVVEHIGSTAVPGLPGKNFVDLGIEADPDDIPAISEAMPRAAVVSRASAPRRSEPHGNVTVTRPATPSSPQGSASADATTKRAFGRPPFRAGAAARRDASVIADATGSMPMTSRSGHAAAAATTARPSPVPRSTMTPP